MSELTLLIMRIGFLLLLWFFVFSIVYALRSDLFGAPVRRMKKEDERVARPAAPQPAPQPQQVTAPAPAAPAAPVITPSGGALPSAGLTGPARHLVITSGVAAGSTIPLDDDFITVGRSRDSTLVIVDEYTSTYHARLSRSGDEWVLTDLDSTNGTKLNGQKVTKPVTVPLGTPVTIGTTTFELRP